MEDLAARRFRVGDREVDPISGEITRNGDAIRLELRTLRLLTCLAERPGEVVSIDDLLRQVWPDVTVTPDSVYQAIASLRRVLGDDPKQPVYIATAPRLGYRLIAPVIILTSDRSTQPAGAQPSSVNPSVTPTRADVATAPRRFRARLAWAALALSLTTVATVIVINRTQARRAAAQPSLTSIAVLPFLDLTEHMKEEEFADGITEELIDRLNKVHGLRVPPPTASFYFKNKRRSIPEIARTLDVSYVLDGSTRRSGDRLRVAVRLIRADSGAVVWSESYDRAWGDTLVVQDDIASAVTRALASITPRS